MANNDRSQTASLGCGTLILIALIVMFFSRDESDELKRDIKTLKHDVGEIKQLVEDHKKEIMQLRRELQAESGSLPEASQ